jgi:sterol desaturase/sphingolipid hydroxylase (fatty acid hydroxylase superfamily)
MPPNVIAFAVPFFLSAIVVERLALSRRSNEPYRWGAALSDLDTGIASQVVDAFLKLAGLFAYAWAYTHLRLFTLAESSATTWVVGLVAIDFFYYWWHRCSHVINVLWAVHAVHHQSEEFNFAVALRQPAFEAITIIPFHLPLALLGVPPDVYVVAYSLDLVYQFWVHTELVGRLGPFEKVFNTPSLHRVHHGINPSYLDKNYGGILVVWDRLFGTYELEAEPVVYGVTKPLASYNPLWANLAPFAEILSLARHATGWGEKLRTLVAHPAYRPGGSVAPSGDPPSRTTLMKYDPKTTRSVERYVTAHFLVLLAASGAFMFFADRSPPGPLVLPGLLLLTTAGVLGGWYERRAWAPALDLVRQLAVPPLAFYWALPHVGPRVAGAAAVGTLLVLTGIYLALAPRMAGGPEAAVQRP